MLDQEWLHVAGLGRSRGRLPSDYDASPEAFGFTKRNIAWKAAQRQFIAAGAVSDSDGTERWVRR